MKIFSDNKADNLLCPNGNWKLHHVGIVLKSERQKKMLLKFFPMEFQGAKKVEHYGALCEIYILGNVRLELIFPFPGSPLENFNNGQGGFHHLAFETNKPLEETMEEFSREKGAVFLDDTPVLGVEEMRVAFLPPVNTGGVTIELVQLQDNYEKH